MDKKLESDIESSTKAPRVTPQSLEDEIKTEHYFTASDGVRHMLGDSNINELFPELKLLTFCVLVLKNGFTVTGESACASPENFNFEIGKKRAKEKALEKMWPLLGFRLRDELSRGNKDQVPVQLLQWEQHGTKHVLVDTKTGEIMSIIWTVDMGNAQGYLTSGVLKNTLQEARYLAESLLKIKEK